MRTKPRRNVGLFFWSLSCVVVLRKQLAETANFRPFASRHPLPNKVLGETAVPNQTMIIRRSSRQQAARIACLVPMNTVRFSGSIETMGVSMSFARNLEIYGENELADYLYKVVSGVVRTYKLLNDGRRQVGSFYRQAISSGSRLVASTPRPLKRSPSQKYK